jgi:hypothetical protein
VDARKATQAVSAIDTDSQFDVADALAAFLVAVTEDRQNWRGHFNSVIPKSPADTLALKQALNLLDLDKRVTFPRPARHAA